MNCLHKNPFPDSKKYRRTPADIMYLARLGCIHPSRLSFLRIFLRKPKNESWQFARWIWEIDEKGIGHCVYCIKTPQRCYSLVAFAHNLSPDKRTDRVIATAWDATFALFDGIPTKNDIQQLAKNVPLQEAGRVCANVLCLSRANRSVRLFEHVVDRLSKGLQPNQCEIDNVGYLMRTTAVYGSGKFGAADFNAIATRPEFNTPFQAEMLSVWVIRQFSIDIVEHLAKVRGGKNAASFCTEGRKSLGVGNSTGLGMAPFLIRHPILLNNWMMAREEALARVRAQAISAPEKITQLHKAFEKADENLKKWHSNHPLQMAKLTKLRHDFVKIEHKIEKFCATSAHPWNRLWLWGQKNLSIEGQEALLSLILEPNGALIDGLAQCMSADETKDFFIHGAMSVKKLKALLRHNYEWALTSDLYSHEQFARFWYVSAEKLEPRLGNRFQEDGADREHPLGIAHLAQMLYRALDKWKENTPIAHFLHTEPTHRYIARRVQRSVKYPFGEIRDNLLCKNMLPIDLLRTKLAFLGATRFDPRSDRWVRVSLFQDQPYPHDITKPIDSKELANIAS